MKTKEKIIGTFEAKTHLSSVVDDVQKGTEYTITKRGKPIAKLIPFIENKDSLKIDKIIELFDTIRNKIHDKIPIKEYIKEGRKN